MIKQVDKKHFLVRVKTFKKILKKLKFYIKNF